MLHNDITLCETRKKMCEAVRLTFSTEKNLILGSMKNMQVACDSLGSAVKLAHVSPRTLDPKTPCSSSFRRNAFSNAVLLVFILLMRLLNYGRQLALQVSRGNACFKHVNSFPQS